MAEPAKPTRPDPYGADQPQPHCNICGRFAYRDKDTGQWRLGCVWSYEDGYEHE